MRRNPFCPHYLKCLNNAAKAGYPLNCEDCPHFREDTGDRGSEKEFFGLVLLWVAVFQGREAAERLRQGEDAEPEVSEATGEGISRGNVG